MNQLTAEQMKSLKEAKSSEEIMELAKANGIEITKADADNAYEYINNRDGEISDEELDNVTGGCGSPLPPDSGATPLFHVGEIAYYATMLDGKHTIRVLVKSVSKTRITSHFIGAGKRTYWEYDVYDLDGKMEYSRTRTCYEPNLSKTKD